MEKKPHEQGCNQECSNAFKGNINSLICDWLQWLKTGRDMTENTLLAYQSDVDYFCDFMKKYKGEGVTLSMLQDLTVTDIRAWLAERHRNDFNRRSTARTLSGVKSFILYLQGKSLLSDHPIFVVKPPRVNKTLPRPLSVEQTMDLIQNINQISDVEWVGKRDKALLMLLYGCGLRINEALSLNYGCLMNHNGYLTVFGKGKKFRRVPILPVVVDSILGYTKICPFTFDKESPLFLGVRGARLVAGVAEKQLRVYRSLAGLPDWATPHALRHSCATHLMEATSDMRAIQELLGHASPSTTQIYTDVSQEHLLAAYNKAFPRK